MSYYDTKKLQQTVTCILGKLNKCKKFAEKHTLRQRILIRMNVTFRYFLLEEIRLVLFEMAGVNSTVVIGRHILTEYDYCYMIDSCARSIVGMEFSEREAEMIR